MSADYDQLAWFYDRYWATRYHDAAEPALERLFYRRVPPPAPVLDLCCGTGHLTERLLGRGYEVVGVDASPGMLRHAVQRAGAARFVCADLTRFAIRSTFAGALSTFDSINHVMADAALARAFTRVRDALRPGGRFVFDVNTAAAYDSEWGKTSALVEDDAALFIAGSHDRASGRAETRLTLFRRDGAWQRTDVRIEQRALDPPALVTMLHDAGFGEVTVTDAAAAGMRGDIAVGRVFLTAHRDR